MKKQLSTISVLRAALFTAMFAIGNSVYGQVSAYTFSQSVGTYTPITGGTLLGSTANDDERFVDPAVLAGGFSNTGVGFPIGFNFTYNGQTFDRFAINANGWISLGQSALTPAVNMSSTSVYTPIQSTSTITPNQLRSRIAGFARDLAAQAGSELRTELIGTAPNQVRVIQWTNYTAYFETGQSLSFQIRLNEFDNSVEVVYSTMTPNANATPAQVGLGGFTATDFNNRTTTTDWNTTTAGVANSAQCAFSNTVTMPVSGRTFKWMLVVSPIDMQATALASPGTLGCFGNNQTVSVVVRNNGTATLDFSVNPVTVNAAVTGPNPATFTPVILNSGTLAAAATQTVVITTTYNMSVNGAYVFSANTAVTGDGNTANDAMNNATVTVSRVNTFPHVEGFSAIPNPAFVVQQVSGTGNWSVTTTGNMTNPALAPALNPGFAFFNCYSFSTGTTSRLITPCYDMTTLSNPAIDIWMSQDIGYSTAPYDRVEVRVSTDGGVTWSAPLQTINRYNAAFTTAGWLQVTVPLTGYQNQSSVRIALQGISQFGNNIGIDQIRVYEQIPVDLQPTVLVSPITSSCHGAAENVTVTVRNVGIGTADFSVTPMTINVNVTGASTQVFTTTITSGTLASNATGNFTVTTAANMTAQGTHNFAVATVCTADGNNANNNLAANVVVGDINSIPAVENFDGARLGWTINQVTGAGNWAYTTGNMSNPTLAPRSGNSLALFGSYNFFPPVTSRLATPCINFTGVQNPSLEFYMSADVGYPNSNDRVEVRISTDGGATYGPVIFTASRYDAAFTTPGWKRYTVCLSSVANLANVKIAFDGVSEYGNNIGLDDIRIYESVPAVPGTVTAGVSGVCIGDSTTVTIAGNTGAIQWQSSLTGLVGTWSNVVGATNATLSTGALSDTIYYRAVVTNTDACALSDTTSAVQVSAYPLPVQVLSDVVQCGGTVTLDAQNGGATYLWSDNSTNQTLAVTASGSYDVLITSALGCENRDTAVVTINALPVVNLGADTTRCAGTVTLDAANNGATYLWSDASTGQTLTVSTTGIYAVEVTDANNCSGVDTISVVINSLPVVNLGVDTTQCGGPVVLDAQNAGATYMWSDSSSAQTLAVTTSGVYYVNVIDANGCESTDTVAVTINALPVVNLGADIVQCSGIVTLDAQNAGSTYMWNDSTTAQTLTASASGTYSVMVTDTNSCSASDTINITINALPVVDLGVDTAFCGGSITLDAGVAASYLWNDSTTAQTLVATATGTYYVTVTDSIGCTNSDSIAVTVNTPPTVTGTAAATTVCLDDADVTLTGAPAGGTWSGPGVSGNNFDPSVGAGVQSLTYTYTDSVGCSGTASVTVTVDACVGVDEQVAVQTVNVYPNPNNGVFSIALNGFNGNTVVEVYDMLGKQVFGTQLNGVDVNNVTEVNLQNVTSGLYMVRVINNGQVTIVKMNVQR